MTKSILKACLAIALSIGMSSAAMAQKYLGSIERKEPEFDQLVPADAKIEIIAEGFTWTEGPVWMGDHLLFCCGAGQWIRYRST